LVDLANNRADAKLLPATERGADVLEELRELKHALDQLFDYNCEHCGKPLSSIFGEVCGTETKEREIILCASCLKKWEAQP